MKKVLALVLAVMMMATVAFAATYRPEGVYDSGNGNQDATGMTVTNGVVSSTYDLAVTPGDKIAISRSTLDDSDLSALGLTTTKAVNSDNYYVTSIKYNDGRNLISGITFNDEDDQVEVKFVKNYTNTKAKDWDVEFTLHGKGREKPDQVKFRLKGTVKNNAVNGSTSAIVAITSADDAIKMGDNNPIPVEKTVYKFETPTGYTDKYATLELTASDTDVEVSVRVYDGNKFYLYNDQDADSDVLKAYADTDADLTFLNFPGTPEFDATATVRFYKEEGTYIYANNGDGKLSRITAANAGGVGQTAGNVKWDDDEGCYILKTRKLGSYVFSDKPLKVSAAADNAANTNPDTGANDVVGIASALAVVALVSAAAVSLKK